MAFSRGQIDRIAFVACLCGWGWIVINLNGLTERLPFSFCPIKQVLGVPCPACGSTHAVIQVFEGHILEALRYNPLGLILAAGLILVPIWVIIDIIGHRYTFRSFYNRFESWFSQKKIALPAAALLLANWVWNLLKY